MFRIDTERIGRFLRDRGRIAGWLLKRLRTGIEQREQRKSRLALVDRISLAPRQSLALVEAEGRRFLIAISPEGSPTFCALEDSSPVSANASKLRTPASFRKPLAHSSRVSW